MSALERSLKELQIPNSFWPLPLIDSLAESGGNLALVSWIANCLLRTLQSNDDPFFDSMRDQVKDIETSDSIQSVEKLIESWGDSHPSENLVRCHIHFLLAKKSLLTHDSAKFRTSVVWAVLALCDGEGATGPRVSIVFDEYKRLLNAKTDSET